MGPVADHQELQSCSQDETVASDTVGSPADDMEAEAVPCHTVQVHRMVAVRKVALKNKYIPRCRKSVILQLSLATAINIQLTLEYIIRMLHNIPKINGKVKINSK